MYTYSIQAFARGALLTGMYTSSEAYASEDLAKRHGAISAGKEVEKLALVQRVVGGDRWQDVLLDVVVAPASDNGRLYWPAAVAS